jgi:hypothetical protein
MAMLLRACVVAALFCAGVGFGVWGVEFGVSTLGFDDWGLWFKVWFWFHVGFASALCSHLF